MVLFETGTISERNIAGPCAISVIVPAYNEQRRLPRFLRTMRGYFEAERGSRYEVIVVDDGSDDGTLDYLEGVTQQWPRLSVIRHLSNRGKGAAVRTGMLAARGDWLLFADADGATPIEEERKLRCAIAAGATLQSARVRSAARKRYDAARPCAVAPGGCFALSTDLRWESLFRTRSAVSRCSAALLPHISLRR